MIPLSREEAALAVEVDAQVAAVVHFGTLPRDVEPSAAERQRPVRPPATGSPPEPVQLPLPTDPAKPAERPAARLVGDLVEAPPSPLPATTLDRLERIRADIAAWEPAPCPPGWTP